MNVLVEPSCLVFAADGDEHSIAREFTEHFWPTFQRVQALVELNQLQIPVTADLHVAAQTLYPYSALSGMRRGSGIEAANTLLRFVEKWARAAAVEYAGREGEIDQSNLQRPRVYSNDDIWLAWLDLLAQACATSSSCREIVCSTTHLSFLPVSSAKVAEPEVVVHARRPSDCAYPSGTLDPGAYEILCGRAPAGNKVAWEDSGHQPSDIIKRVLVRTARAREAFTLRVGTTYHVPGVVETCKLFSGDKWCEVGFRISDRDDTFKGVFTTSATTAAEQQIALVLLGKDFSALCSKEGLRMRD